MDDVKKRLEETRDETAEMAEQTRYGFQQLVDRIEKLTDLFRYGDAFIKKVGDYDPPKRTTA